MSKINDTEEPQQEKVMTKYDRKVQQRKETEKKDKRDNLVNKIIVIALAVVVVAAIAVSVGIAARNRAKAVSETFVQIGDHDITGVEYKFYFNTVVSNYLNAYASVLPYMGLDPSVSFASQKYDETMTWQDVFDKMTVEQICEIKAMSDDAKEKGFVYETEAEDYKAFREGFNSKAEEAGVAVSDYYKNMFGEYASESRLEPFVKETLLVTAYTRKLNEDYRPSEDVIKKQYEDNKNDYDLVDYYSYSFFAQVKEDSTEKEIETMMNGVTEKAEKMKADRIAGTPFQELCDAYGSDKKEDSEETDGTEEKKEKNLFTQSSFNAIPGDYAEWLFDASRKEKDIEIFRDEKNNKVTVVEFVARNYNEDTDTIISNQIVSKSIAEYTDELTENYEVSDVAGELLYLTKPDAADDSTAEDTEESVSEED